jgi:hypothetical protein
LPGADGIQVTAPRPVTTWVVLRVVLPDDEVIVTTSRRAFSTRNASRTGSPTTTGPAGRSTRTRGGSLSA